MSADSQNVYGNSRLQSPNFTLKLQGCAKVFRVIHFLNPFSSLITVMSLVSSLHVGPYPSWASDTPCACSADKCRALYLCMNI